jgi:hypothetical protein
MAAIDLPILLRRVVLSLVLALISLGEIPAHATQSIARNWNERILIAIRNDTPHPPAHARNLFHLSVVMYDAWAAYDTNATGYLYRSKHTAPDVALARREAISYAAWRLLRERYAYSVTASNTLFGLNQYFVSLGYDTNNNSFDTSTPAGVGNSIHSYVSNYFIMDGARQLNAYADAPANEGGYVALNNPLVVGLAGNPNFVSLGHWQPLAIANAVDQNGFPMGPIQPFVGGQWLGVRPFAHKRDNATLPWIDPGVPPTLFSGNDGLCRAEILDVIRASGELTPDDGVTMDISPAGWGNNPLGSNGGTGRSQNPFTALPYTPNVVKRGDFSRVLAEFWADGPQSETPPGHWNVLANFVADNTNFVKRIGGVGPVVDDLEWDVKTYFAMNGALHDAACAAWSLKRYYDSPRPISLIRWMGSWGQCTDLFGASYSPNGLPLESNVCEVVTVTTMSGRHLGFAPGQIVIRAWPGQPANPATQYSGVRWVSPSVWQPYQRTNFVTPAFPGYISGHSSFSRAAAEVLSAITGSPFFPGGLGTYTCPATNFLSFERGPSQTLQLQWATYYDAADQAGLSRIWGGIHVSVDDLTGRVVGSQCGSNAWSLARKYFDNSIHQTPTQLEFARLNSSQHKLRYETLRGFHYTLQSAPRLNQPMTNEPAFAFVATNSSLILTQNFNASGKLFRVLRSP